VVTNQVSKTIELTFVIYCLTVPQSRPLQYRTWFNSDV